MRPLLPLLPILALIGCASAKTNAPPPPVVPTFYRSAPTEPGHVRPLAVAPLNSLQTISDHFKTCQQFANGCARGHGDPAPIFTGGSPEEVLQHCMDFMDGCTGPQK